MKRLTSSSANSNNHSLKIQLQCYDQDAYIFFIFKLNSVCVGEICIMENTREKSSGNVASSRYARKERIKFSGLKIFVKKFFFWKYLK